MIIWSLFFPPVVARQNNHFEDKRIVNDNLHQSCPGCPYQEQLPTGPKDSNLDDLRLEAIKHQILTKLGLKSRPDVNRTLASVPRKLALETIYRAEHSNSPPSLIISSHSSNIRKKNKYRNRMKNRYLDERKIQQKNKNQNYQYGGKYTYNIGNEGSVGGSLSDQYFYRNSQDLTRNNNKIDDESVLSSSVYQDRNNEYGSSLPLKLEVMDDFYAKTSEIITFAEPGKLRINLFTIKVHLKI